MESRQTILLEEVAHVEPDEAVKGNWPECCSRDMLRPKQMFGALETSAFRLWS
jgi:hypothetical protein